MEGSAIQKRRSFQQLGVQQSRSRSGAVRSGRGEIEYRASIRRSTDRGRKRHSGQVNPDRWAVDQGQSKDVEQEGRYKCEPRHTDCFQKPTNNSEDKGSYRPGDTCCCRTKVGDRGLTETDRSGAGDAVGTGPEQQVQSNREQRHRLLRTRRQQRRRGGPGVWLRGSRRRGGRDG